jgi:hypothetical protein
MPRWRVDIIRKRAERERTAARAAAEAKRAEAERKAIAEAEKKIVASWNAHPGLTFPEGYFGHTMIYSPLNPEKGWSPCIGHRALPSR